MDFGGFVQSAAAGSRAATNSQTLSMDGDLVIVNGVPHIRREGQRSISVINGRVRGAARVYDYECVLEVDGERHVYDTGRGLVLLGDFDHLELKHRDGVTVKGRVAKLRCEHSTAFVKGRVGFIDADRYSKGTHGGEEGGYEAMAGELEDGITRDKDTERLPLRRCKALKLGYYGDSCKVGPFTLKPDSEIRHFARYRLERDGAWKERGLLRPLPVRTVEGNVCLLCASHSTVLVESDCGDLSLSHSTVG